MKKREIKQHFTDSPIESWDLCFPVWKDYGRVNDFPHGIRYPSYFPSPPKVLGNEYASRFFRDHGHVLGKLKDSDPTARLCAFDLLESIAWEFFTHDEELPASLTEISATIPDTALQEIRSEYHFSDFGGDRVGEFLPFLIEHG